MKQINLKKLVSNMRTEADMFPFNPLDPVSWQEKHKKVKQYQHRIKFEGYVLLVTLTRDTLPDFDCREFYHLSLGNDQGNPDLIPKRIVWHVRQAFMPHGVEFPSKLGNCLQFIEPIAEVVN